MKTGCKDCSDRRVGCHSICEKYLAEKKARDELRKLYLKRKGEDRAVGDVLATCIRNENKNKIKRRISRKKRY